MGFIDSYKSLEKLCGEIYGNNHGVSAYIDNMIASPNGSYYVSGWDEDLKQLKHYRWLRNQIVHEPGCSEENMCEPGDIQWLNNFHSRIMSQSDPLTLYRKAKNAQTISKSKQSYSSNSTAYTYSQRKKPSSKPIGCFTYLIGALLLTVVAIIIFNII